MCTSIVTLANVVSWTIVDSAYNWRGRGRGRPGPLQLPNSKLISPRNSNLYKLLIISNHVTRNERHKPTKITWIHENCVSLKEAFSNRGGFHGDIDQEI